MSSNSTWCDEEEDDGKPELEWSEDDEAEEVSGEDEDTIKEKDDEWLFQKVKNLQLRLIEVNEQHRACLQQLKEEKEKQKHTMEELLDARRHATELYRKLKKE